jgi:hypothetical protein
MTSDLLNSSNNTLTADILFRCKVPNQSTALRLKVLHLTLLQETRKKSEKPKESEKSDALVVYYTRQRIEGFVVLIMTFMILVLLIIPIYLLYHLTRGAESTRITAICIGVLLISTLLFAAGISLFTSKQKSWRALEVR